MNNITKSEKKVTFFLFLLLYVSNDTLLFGTNNNRTFFIIHIAILICSFVWLIFDNNFSNTKRTTIITLPKNVAIIMFLLIGLTLLTMIINTDITIKYIYQIFIILFSGCFVTKVTHDDFIASYNMAVYVLAWASIIAYFTFMFVPTLCNYLPQITNVSGIKYIFYGLGVLELNPTESIPRSYGVFREPGVFAIFLLFALIFELFFAKNIKIKRIAVYIAAGVLTLSTMAILVIPIVVAIYLLYLIIDRGCSKKHNVFLGILAILMIALVIIAITGTFEKLFAAAFNKLLVNNSSRDSRFYSIIVNIDMMLRNPVLGNGWKYVEDNFITYGNKYSSHIVANTNTIFKVLSIYGVVYFSVFLKEMYGFTRKFTKGIIPLLLLFSFFVVLSNEDMMVNILIYIIIFYGEKTRISIR